MPWNEVMHKFKHGDLHSGSSSGKKVQSRNQAIAIMMSEKRKAAGGKKEYQAKKKGGLVEKPGKILVSPYEGSPEEERSESPAKERTEKKKKVSPFKKQAQKNKRGFASIG
jgi:hypothetical protein